METMKMLLISLSYSRFLLEVLGHLKVLAILTVWQPHEHERPCSKLEALRMN